jgi:hypothetical protein
MKILRRFLEKLLFYHTESKFQIKEFKNQNVLIVFITVFINY